NERDTASAWYVVALSPGPGAGAEHSQSCQSRYVVAVVTTCIKIETRCARLLARKRDSGANDRSAIIRSGRAVGHRISADQDSVASQRPTASCPHHHWRPRGG